LKNIVILKPETKKNKKQNFEEPVRIYPETQVEVKNDGVYDFLWSSTSTKGQNIISITS